MEAANEIRTRRAQLKRDLKAGKVQIEGLLLNPPEFLETAKVFDMMLAVPKYGRVKVNRILNQCRVSPSKTIGASRRGSARNSSPFFVAADAGDTSTPLQR